MTKACLKSSFGFGVASGVITTLGLMVGLFASTNSRGVVLGGILTIAAADSMADAVGMHFSEDHYDKIKSEYIEGIAETGETIKIILDIKKVLTEEEFVLIKKIDEKKIKLNKQQQKEAKDV